MLADYCWTVIRDAPTDIDKREAKKCCRDADS